MGEESADGSEDGLDLNSGPDAGASLVATAHRAHADEETLTVLARFVNKLEESSPFMSFNYIVGRTYESRVLPMSSAEISSLLDEAIQSGLFQIDSRTILDRATGEYRDINIFRLNRQHPLVAEALQPSKPKAAVKEEQSA